MSLQIPKLPSADPPIQHTQACVWHEQAAASSYPGELQHLKRVQQFTVTNGATACHATLQLDRESRQGAQGTHLGAGVLGADQEDAVGMADADARPGRHRRVRLQQNEPVQARQNRHQSGITANYVPAVRHVVQ